MKNKLRNKFYPLLIILIYFLSVGCTKEDERVFVTDIDGNIYNTIKIGTQVWMVENLKTTKYNDGTAIPLVSNSTSWSNLSTPGYCWYNNDADANKKKYGALYNWHAVNTGKLCPSGWHVPSDAEWTIMENYLIANGYNYDGTTSENKIAKSLAATTNWNATTATCTVGSTGYPNNRNKTGFTALPAGARDGNPAMFGLCGDYCAWWSTSEFEVSNNYAWIRSIYHNNWELHRRESKKQMGLSVRCLKD